VLDRLLEDESLPLDGVSGTSAGALNAAVLATGFADGGPRRSAVGPARLLVRRGCFGHNTWPSVSRLADGRGLGRLAAGRRP
jgi:hypothetical protein